MLIFFQVFTKEDDDDRDANDDNLSDIKEDLVDESETNADRPRSADGKSEEVDASGGKLL